MKLNLLTVLTACVLFAACKKENSAPAFFVNEDPSTFKEIGTIDIGDTGAAEISAFDPLTKKLFVVNNAIQNKIDILDFSDPSNIKPLTSISTSPYGGFVNSLSVSNGKLAAAIEAVDKQADGKVVVFNTVDNSEIKVIVVGAMPDMVTFSPNGKYILTANEGEPNDDLSNDPEGTVSLIDIENNYATSTLNFSGFESQKANLVASGLRISVSNFAKDIEPEYITVSEDSKTAWVTLQENNGIAKINLETKTITNIFPLGFKDFKAKGNEVDISDKDDIIALAKWNVKGTYMPDALAVLTNNGVPYIFTANEGDAREYSGLTDVERMKSLKLDPTIFPDFAALKADSQIGRLNLISNLGDTDGDGDLDVLYSFGARSFSVWNGNTGAIVFDSKNELDQNKGLKTQRPNL